MSFSQHDRETVAKLLGLIGSVHDAEALAAARKAYELVKARGTTWQDVLLVRPTVGRRSMPGEASGADHILQATDLLRRGRSILSPWERNFLRGIMVYRVLKPRQAEWLALINRKVAAATPNAA